MLNPYLKKDYDIADLLLLAHLCQRVWDLTKQQLDNQTAREVDLHEAECKMKEHMTKLWGPIY